MMKLDCRVQWSMWNLLNDNAFVEYKGGMTEQNVLLFEVALYQIK